MSASQEMIRKSPTKLTYKEYVLFPCDGNRHEIIDGRHYMNAAPNPRHQTVSRHIQFQLYEQLERKGFGQVFDAPIDLQLTECDVVQPDLVVVLSDNQIITSTKIKGIPDLIVEILSPSNRDYDEGLKKQLYEQSSVPQFWIVDPEEQCVWQYRLLPEGRYAAAIECSQNITFGCDHRDVTVDLLSARRRYQ
jgi:Uma2 family endonuclease